MANLRKFDLLHDEEREDWFLKEEGSSRARRRFDRKEDATRGGVLAGELGKQGGSVRIHNRDGDYQEERTYPRSRDPKKSPG